MSEMTPTPESEASVAALIGAVNRLGESLNTMSQRLEDSDRKISDSNDAINTLAESTKRSRRQLVALAVSVSLDVLLSISVVLFGVKVFSTSNDAKAAADLAQAVATANADNTYNTCLASNETRMLNGQLWDFVLGVRTPDQPPPTEAQQAAIKLILDQVHRTFAPRDCGPDPTPSTTNVGLPPILTSPSTTITLPSTPPST